MLYHIINITDEVIELVERLQCNASEKYSAQYYYSVHYHQLIKQLMSEQLHLYMQQCRNILLGAVMYIGRN